ncbi:SigB/SigF/SigG family RNA polymerase sigma factor [Streptomyces sp. SLBN-31]|uniref:SigB/SigF/SigG family RNA polymerase sigma factor n=1 Tax=Streptomyces sp. SLBN-31 TaxID=2768444 RepID=UPI00114FEE27|nr:SigB/SigF/SigG family RNA polymerase sigma factor [Streptomyces sp. SLBN-31]TQJ85893.1 RNA polymerase sigma-B factor [Streptomyces sp. SLBN-31]
MRLQNAEPGPGEARARSGPLFERLRSLEERTAEYAYVRNTLVELNMWIVRQAARRFPARREMSDDVLQAGAIGLIKAIDRFDPARGFVFEAYAVPTVVGEIKRFYRDTTWAVHVPRRLKECRGVLREAVVAFEQSEGRSPRVSELVERTGLSEEEVVEGLQAADGHEAVSLDAPLGSGADGTEIAERLGAEDPALRRTDDLVTLAPLLAALPERERRILTMRFLHDMTQSQIGAELGISQMHVSRLLSRTLAGLRTRLR